MKILSIGDIHGRPYWKRIDISKYDKIIFVGDYVDSFPFNDQDILSNLLDIIELKKNNLDKVVLLLGNHDIQYMYLNEGFGCSGYRPSMAATLKHVFMENKKLFQMAHQIDNYIWTHAGISSVWFDFNKDEIKEFSDKFEAENLVDAINKMMFTNTNRILHQVGRKRSGRYPSGGITWADRDETKNNYIDGFHQIVGHSPIDVITKWGDDKSSIRYIDVQHKLEYFKNLDNIVLTDYFYEFEITNKNDNEILVNTTL